MSHARPNSPAFRAGSRGHTPSRQTEAHLLGSLLGRATGPPLLDECILKISHCSDGGSYEPNHALQFLVFFKGAAKLRLLSYRATEFLAWRGTFALPGVNEIKKPDTYSNLQGIRRGSLKKQFRVPVQDGDRAGTVVFASDSLIEDNLIPL